MAKSTASNDAHKVTFGVRKKGQAQKSYNKHTPRPKAYRRQGR